MTRYAGPAMLAGTYAMFSFEVTCEPMDVEISFRKGADESRNDARRSDGDAAAYVDELSSTVRKISARPPLIRVI